MKKCPIFSFFLLILFIILLFFVLYFSIKDSEAEKNPENKNYITPILVIGCYRPDALKNHVKQLLKYRNDPIQFPIFVSIDCDSPETKKVAKNFGSAINFIEYGSEIETNQYKRIARHYKKAIDRVFNTSVTYDSIIITEDDLNISPDFFNYFQTTRPLLDQDTSLWCVSAWNDNGKKILIDTNATTTLYRSDFKAGLGWMMIRSLWIDELSNIWPDGYWDDWMMLPEIRKGRQCIRPEVGRTSMSFHGMKGASDGQFFNQYLSRIVHVDHLVTELKDLNLTHFLKNNYDKIFKKQVFEDTILSPTWPDRHFRKMTCKNGQGLRIPYTDFETFARTNRLDIMRDTKSAVPRTAYHGIVTFYQRSCRFFLFSV